MPDCNAELQDGEYSIVRSQGQENMRLDNVDVLYISPVRLVSEHS
jgi:hypothetical protein